MNIKKTELAEMLYKNLKEQFEEIKFINITPSADNPENLWVNIILPEDDDRRSDLEEKAAEISTDILDNYGYHIIISSSLPNELIAV